MLSVCRPTFVNKIIVSIILLSIIIPSMPALAVSIPSVGVASPDPAYASGPVTVEYTLNGISNGTAWLAVKNQSGNIIRMVNGGPVSGSGTHSITWDGKDGSGNPVPIGQYTLLVAVNRSGLEYVGEWGGKSVAYPQAWGVAINSTGYAYVTDSVNSNVIIYDPSGNFVRVFGSAGPNPGQLYCPGNPAINSSGYVFIADYSNKRLEVFDRNGGYVGEINYTSGPGQFVGPGDVALNSTGHIFVTDYEGHNVKVFSPSWTYEYTIGGTVAGAGNGQFNYPNGITVGASDRVYVADGGNNRVQVFDRNGAFLSSFGSSGTTDGKFSGPNGITINSTGYIYVVDGGNNRVQVFDSTGAFLYKFGSSGSNNGQFNYPYGIAVNTSGFVYVVDNGNGRVQVFDRSGVFSYTLGPVDAEDGKFNQPGAITVGPSGQVYVGDTRNYRVQVFNRFGDFLFAFGSKGSGDGQFSEFYGIAVNSSGYIYVPEYNNHRVQVFDPSGNYLFKFGTEGTGNGQFGTLWDIAVNSTDYVYVGDSANHRIQVFDAMGNYKSQFNDGLWYYLWTPTGIAFNSTDYVYAIDNYDSSSSGHHRRVCVYNSSNRYQFEYGSSGSENGQFNNPTGIAIDPFGFAYIADNFNQRIQMFNPTGAFVSKIGAWGKDGGNFSSPYDVAVGNSGAVYVADMYNNRIQVLSYYVIANVTLIVERTAPYVVSTSPTAGESHAGAGDHITVTLSEPANASTVNSSTFYVYPASSPGSHLSGTFSVSGNNITFIPDAPLTRGVSYNAVITSGVTDRAGNAMASSYSWTFTTEPIPAPVVTGIAPSSGPASGGTSVTITGSNFTGATAVTFGGTAAVSFIVNSDTQVTAVSPAHTPVTVDVTVTTASGTSATSSADQFTYIPVPVVTGLSPSDGPVAGGTTVTITGTYFTGTTVVMFGGTPASSFTVDTDTQITAVSPSGSAGPVDVTVTTTYGTSALSPVDRFTYVPAPTVSSIAPSSGPTSGGISVTITGTGFTGATAVIFGATPATSFTVVSDTQITAVCPAGSGTVGVTVTTAGGTSATSPADRFTYLAPVLPVADFEADVVSGVAPLTVHFSSLSTGYPTLCEWNFGDGSSNISGIAATHTYSSAGVYTVTMTASNSNGSSTMEKVDYISVSSAPVTSFTIPLKAGWNLVSLPLVNNSISASSLGSIGVTDVARFNNTAKVYDIYMVGISPAEYDFNLRTDDGYFIKCSHDASLVVMGSEPGVRSLPLYTGWNIVGWSNLTGSDTLTVSGVLGSVTDIARYNTTTHDFDVYMVGVSPVEYNFPMGAGEGYFVKTSNNLVFPYGGY